MSDAAIEVQDWIKTGFTGLEKSLNGQTGSPFHQLREKAYAAFGRVGFPTPRDEAWKYTPVAALAKIPYKLAPLNETAQLSSTELNELLIEGVSEHRMVFVNGIFDAQLSEISCLPEGVAVRSLDGLLNAHEGTDAERKLVEKHLGAYAGFEDDAFVALNTAFIKDGVFLHVAKGVKIEAPIHFIFVGTESECVSHVRTLIVADEESQVTLVESFQSSGSNSLTTSVAEFVAGAGAVIDHYRLQIEGSENYHYSSIGSAQQTKSCIRTSNFAFGGKLVRNDVRPVVNGEHADTFLNGLSVLDAGQHVDNYTVVDHAVPNCESTELYKGVYQDASRGIFSGTIIVRPDAQKTNAIQNSKGLLLSDKASLTSRPQLKIWADDVRCTHGATVGQLDNEALFYIRSRGVGKRDAQNMLVHAFVGEVLKEVRVAPLRVALEEKIAQKLGV